MHNDGWDLNMNGRGAHNVKRGFVYTNVDRHENLDGGGGVCMW